MESSGFIQVWVCMTHGSGNCMEAMNSSASCAFIVHGVRHEEDGCTGRPWAGQGSEHCITLQCLVMAMPVCAQVTLGQEGLGSTC